MRAMLQGLDLVDERESLQTALLAIALRSPRNETYQLLRRIVCKIRRLKVEALRKLENLRDKHAKPVCRSRPASATLTITFTLQLYNSFDYSCSQSGMQHRVYFPDTVHITCTHPRILAVTNQTPSHL